MKAPFSTSGRGGFSLVEVAIALAVATICLVALLGLLSSSISTTQSTASETAAVNLMTQVTNDLRATQSGSKSPFYQISIPGTGTASSLTSATGTPTTLFLTATGTAPNGVNGGPSYASTSLTPYRVTLGFLPPAAGTGPQGIQVRILVTWPAMADPTPGTWPSNYSGSLENVVTLYPDAL